jgi:hypothetical protein
MIFGPKTDGTYVVEFRTADSPKVAAEAGAVADGRSLSGWIAKVLADWLRARLSPGTGQQGSHGRPSRLKCPLPPQQRRRGC